MEPSEAPQLAQSPISLLSLPNEILLLIFEEVYEERYGSMTKETPLRTAEILINKRIFSLAGPIWHKRLSINASQLDQRLAGLIKYDSRRKSLRFLEVTLTKGYFNLLEAVILQLESLHHLSIQIFDDMSDEVLTTVALAAASISTLKDLGLGSNGISLNTRQLNTMFGVYDKVKPRNRTRVSLEIRGVPYYIHSPDRGTGLLCLTFRWSPRFPPSLLQFSWSGITSLALKSESGKLIGADDLLRGLEKVVQDEKAATLQRLKLDLRFPSDVETDGRKYFTPDDFVKLLRLLQRTGLKQLHLASIVNIPSIPADVKLHSLQLLRLSGPCSFKDSDSFPHLFNLLSALPSLTQLHLNGSSFFARSPNANEISKCDPALLNFWYPELGILLNHLQRSNVIIFTFRGQDEKRELRWTRSNKEEEFERDCWTL